MPDSDRRREALQLFSGLAERHGLRWSHDFPAEIEISFTVPQQAGLDFRIDLTLQDDDELFIYVDGVRFSFFPFPRVDVVANFSECFERLVDGSARLDVADRFGSAARGEIIRVADGRTLARNWRTFWPFGLRTARSLRNQQAIREQTLR
jgi:hypothetical protein